MVTALRRFEHHAAGVPDRPGINPFTKKSLTIKGRPAKTVRCEVASEGSTVHTCWTWLEGGALTFAPSRRRDDFVDAASAEAYATELVEDLLLDGFQELDPSPVASKEMRGVPVDSAPHRAPEALVAAIMDYCRKRAWFGSDMMLRSAEAHAIERTRFAYRPATVAEIAETERRLGFPLPPLLRTLYLNVANGGFGPGYGFLGVVGGAPVAGESAKDIADAYRIDRDPAPRLGESDSLPGEPDGFEPFCDPWPGRVVRLVHWGCAIWSCLDVRRGWVLRYEALRGKSTRAAMAVEAATLESWLERWVRG